MKFNHSGENYISIMNSLLLVSTIAISYSYFQPAKPHQVQDEREQIVLFMTRMADAGMMSILQGKLAADIATTKEIRDYGARIEQDHSKLLEALQKLADEKQVILPDHLSEENKKELDRLTQKSGTAFNRAFLRKMRVNHNRDVRYLRKAAQLMNAEVKAFAIQYLGMERAHLLALRKMLQ